MIAAEEMFNECNEYFEDTDIAVLSAAVADYRSFEIADQKIKKKSDYFDLQLTKTKDILAHFGKQKKAHQFVAGFALETNNEKENAIAKLQNKNADCIVLNSLNESQAGFGFDTNKVSILYKDGSVTDYGLKSKKEVAKDIVSFITAHLHEK